MDNPGQAQTRRAVSAAVIGNVLEWYDFAVYAYVAVYIARKFFPQGDEVTALLATFLAYGLGFVARPLGGIILGRVGDTHGRKTALLITIALMAVGTVLIGILPTYASIGVAAPAAAGRRAADAGLFGRRRMGIIHRLYRRVGTAEPARLLRQLPADERRRRIAARLRYRGACSPRSSPPSRWTAWGWRIPFLLGGILGPVGLWMRRTIDETPAYKRVAATAPSPTEDKTNPWLLAWRAFGFTIVWTVCFYVLLNYMPTWSRQYLKITPAAALWANTIGLFVLMIAIPFMGKLSDKYGRKPLLLACCIAYIVLPYPIFKFLVGGASYTELIAVQILFAILISMFSGPGPAAIAEIFPTRTRSTWMTSGYALAVAIFGGFAPFISVWLISTFNSPIAHSFYLIAAAIVSTIVIATLRETAHEPLG